MKRSHSAGSTGAAKLVPFCPVCETQYGSASVAALGKEGETELVHLTCRSCSTGVLAVILNGESGSSSVGVVTDLTVEDARRFRRSRRVNTDDVIEVHRLFSDAAWTQTFLPRPVRRPRVKSTAKTPAKRRQAPLS